MSPRDAIDHLKSTIYCILAGAKIVSWGFTRRVEDGDYRLTITIEHRNESRDRVPLIKENITGLSSEVSVD